MIKKFSLILLFAFVSLGSPHIFAQNKEIEAQHIKIVERLLLENSLGINFGYDYKQNIRLGDKAARALEEIFSEEDLSVPSNIKNYLSILRTAFAAPDSINDLHDRNPKVTLSILRRIGERTSLPQLKAEIATCKQFIEEQTSKDPVNKYIPPLNVSNTSAVVFFSELATTYRVPIGLEDVSQGQNITHAINLTFSGGTVGDLLDQFTKAERQYKWAVIDGVINICPSNISESLLEVGIFDFTVQNARVTEVVQDLIQLPEVKKKLNKLGVQYVSINGLTESTEKHSLDLDNLRMREILNKVLKANKRFFWAVSRHGDDNEYLSFTF